MIRHEALLLALLSMALLGVVDFLRKKAMSSGVEPTVFIAIESLFVFTSIMLFIALSGRSFNAPLTALPYASTCGVLIVISLLAMLYALKVGEASVVVPVVRLGFTVTFLLAIAFMSEKLTPCKALGIVFAVLAVVLLSR